jgi:hypothetical protein
VNLEPDVEADTVAYLDSVLSAKVSTKVPNPRVAEMVRVTVVGGAGVINRRVANARLSVEAWAANSVAASELAREAAAYLRDWSEYEARTSTPFSFPDPATDLPRYVFTAELWGLTVLS